MSLGQETQRPHDVAARETSITFVVLRAKTGPLGFVYQFLSASGRPASAGPPGPAPLVVLIPWGILAFRHRQHFAGVFVQRFLSRDCAS